MNSLEAAPISGSQSQSHDQSHDQSLTLTPTPEPVPSQSQPQHIRKQLTWITLCAILICGATGLATVLNIAVLTSCTYWKERNVDIGAFTIGMLQVCQSSLKYATIDFYIDNCDQAPDDVIKSACYRSNAEHILQVIAICIGFIATLLTLYVCFVMSRRLGPSKPPFSSTNMQTFQRIILITFPMLIITFGACFTSFILIQIDYRTHIQLVVTNISTSSPVSVSGKIADFYTFDATFGLHIIAWLLLFFCVIVSCIFYFLSRRVRRSLTSDGMLFTVNDQMGTEISNVQPTFIQQYVHQTQTIASDVNVM